MAILQNFGVPIEGADSGTTLMPKLQYRFRVTFTDIGNNSSATVVARNVVSVTRPSLDHDDVTIDTYNSKIRLAGKHTWQDVTLVIRDDIDSGVIRELGAQLNKQVNHADQSSANTGGDYKFGMTIEMLDGGNAGNETITETWELAGCFIPNIQYGDLNYATSEAVQITATIRYDNASHHAGETAGDGNDILSAADVSGRGSSTATGGPR